MISRIDIDMQVESLLRKESESFLVTTQYSVLPTDISHFISSVSSL